MFHFAALIEITLKVNGAVVHERFISVQLTHFRKGVASYKKKAKNVSPKRLFLVSCGNRNALIIVLEYSRVFLQS